MPGRWRPTVRGKQARSSLFVLVSIFTFSTLLFVQFGTWDGWMLIYFGKRYTLHMQLLFVLCSGLSALAVGYLVFKLRRLR